MSFRDRIQAKALEQQTSMPKGIGFRPELTELGIEDKWELSRGGGTRGRVG